MIRVLLTKREVLEGVAMTAICVTVGKLAEWGVDVIRRRVENPRPIGLNKDVANE